MSNLQRLNDAIESIGEHVEDFKNRYNDRLERLEAGHDRPRASSTYVSGLSRDDHEHKETFLEWVRRPQDERCKSRMAEAQHEMSRKDVSIGTSSAGGYALPKEISQQIEHREPRAEEAEPKQVETAIQEAP